MLCVNITSVNLWLSFVTHRIERPFVQKRGPQSLALAIVNTLVLLFIMNGTYV